MKITEFKIGDEIQIKDAGKDTYTWKLVELTTEGYKALFKPNYHNKDYDERSFIIINFDSDEEFILVNGPKPEPIIYKSRLNLIQND
jgi:hypothetical protein